MAKKERSSRSAKYRLFLVASRTDLLGPSQPMDVPPSQGWNETGFNTRRVQPGLCSLPDFRYHVAAALIPAFVWDDPRLNFLQKFKKAHFFEHFGKIENQISNNRWDEVDIKRIVAIEETGWTNQELNDVTNQFNVILWNCWQNDWPRQKKPYYNPLWWNCHDVAMLFIHLLDISGASDKKLPRIYHLLCRRRRDLQITIESHMLAPSTIASSLQSAIHILSDLGQVTGILGAGAGVGAASLTVSAGGIGFEAAGGALVATNPLLAGICALGLTGFLAIKLYSIINQKASLKMRAKIMACVEEKLPRLKEANQWVESGLTDSEDTLTEGFKLFQQWLATDV
ncbi:uncharacterized protein N7473_013220 [Penicillium subrubescens]|uniref:uncharacterized protein n=1 Tax=Penicillium subrubescens TaxID=1316194 RepID=UPI002545B6C9|nr:uncharacterized protein N7473_013220 [Penicillium subrubescens]KAJ5873661.1 hypothetical protein N7473_013220 [Penicillium subrubescens]